VRSPWALPEDQFKWGVNINVRGGIVQTRPGFSMRLSVPKGNFQGGVVFNANKQASAATTITTNTGSIVYRAPTIFTPSGQESSEREISYIVFCVNGRVYYAPFPLTQPKDWDDYRLSGIELDPNIDRVNFAIATKSAETNPAGGVTVTPSHRIVVIQDGVSTPHYWDGSDLTGQRAADAPVGFWMAFSGNRLWVASENVIQASDLGNPLGWTERVSGAGRGDFSIPRPVTGMTDHIGQNNDSRLFVFSDRSTFSFASGVLDRSLWASTPNFQNTLYPNIGCVAGKSICFQAGMMWWFSQGGLVSADVAASSYLSSQVLYKDVEMARVKRLMAQDITQICAASFENYLLTSIPYLEKGNSATMVLDYVPASEWNQSRSPAWAGIWTGIRPIEWTSGFIGNQPRLFAFSVDYGATEDASFNHIWEAFTPNRFDTYLTINQDGSATEKNQRIYASMETGLLGDAMDLKQMVYAEIDASQISGSVDVKVSYRGSKGQYKDILQQRIIAITDKYQWENSADADKIREMGLLRTQYRRLTTESVHRTNTSTCESINSPEVDKAFSLLMEWCGAFGVESIRMFLDPYPEPSVGRLSLDQSVPCVVAEDGSSMIVNLETPSKDVATTKDVWVSQKTITIKLSCTNGSPSVSGTSTAEFISYVSQEDADIQATAIATRQATTAAQQYRIKNPC